MFIPGFVLFVLLLWVISVSNRINRVEAENDELRNDLDAMAISDEEDLDDNYP